MKTDITSYFLKNQSNGYFLPLPKLLEDEEPELKRIYATSYASSPVAQKVITSILTSIITNKVKYFYTLKSNMLDITNRNPNCPSFIPSISSSTNSQVYTTLIKLGITPIQNGNDNQYGIYEVKNISHFARFDKNEDFSLLLREVLKDSKKHPYKEKEVDSVAEMEIFDPDTILAEIDRLNNEDI